MSETEKKPTLVVLQLTGGNDGLNTIVPYGDGLYYDKRPVLAVPQADVLPIDNHFGFHKSLSALKPFWDQKQLAIICGIGHDWPNYSHFRSMDMWHTASPDKVSHDGWLGQTVRALDPHAENVLTAVNVGRGLPRALSFQGTPVASVAQLDTYGLLTSLSSADERNTAVEMFSCMYDDGMNDSLVKSPMREVHAEDPMNRVLGYMGRTGLDAKKGAEILASALGKYSSTVKYPNSPIAQNMKAIAQIKLAEVGTRIFYTAHGSFDTHATQAGLHAQLLKEISEATSAFFADLREHNASDDVVLLMFSEFGRRVSDNGGGTDHGAGNVAFVVGDPVKGGMYGEYPSLDDGALRDGNLNSTNDFRSTYSTVLERWLRTEAKPVVSGNFEQFAFLGR